MSVTEEMKHELSDERLIELRDEFADWLDGLPPELPDGPGAVSACYTSLSFGEVFALVTEVQAAREKLAKYEDAVKPFWVFINGDVDNRLPADMPLTQGSSMARKQLTVADFRRLAALKETTNAA